MSLTGLKVTERSVTAPGGPRGRPQSSLLQAWALSGLPPSQRLSRLAFSGLILCLVIVSIICFVNAIRWVDKPFAGFLMNERMVPGNVGQYHWPGTQAGLRYPDKILTANGQPISSRHDLDRVIQQTRLGESIKYTVSRGGRLVELSVPTIRFAWLDLIMTFGVTFLSGVAYLLIGGVVFLVKPDTRPSWTFLLFCFFLSAYAITAFDIQSTHWGFARLYFFVLAFVPAAAIHLSLVFPERTRLLERHPRVELVPYLVSVALITPLEVFYPRPPFMFAYQMILAYLFVGALAIAGSSLQAYFRRASALARQRAKVVLSGAALAFPLPALAQYLSLFGGVPMQNNFLAIPIIAFPASIAYAIAKHNLFDVDIYIKRAVGYAIMTGLVATTYVTLQTLMRTVLLGPLFGERADALYPVVFALLVVFLFNPVNRRIQEVIDRLFFRKRFDYKKTVSVVSDALTSMLNLDQILQKVVNTIRNEMFIDSAGVILAEANKDESRVFLIADTAVNGGVDVRSLTLPPQEPLLVLLRSEKVLITKYDLEEDPRYAAAVQASKQRFADLGASLAIPLLYQGSVTGALIVGEKKSGQFYSREDIDLLTTMANQAAVAIQNASAHEEVVRYAQELAASLRKIQILESIKSNLAKFVPRTVQALIEESPEAPSLEKREADLSVLFADITGYTRLSALMELDEINRLVERYFGAFLDEITRYGGDVNETAGDGLMVIFRDPEPRRHAQAAVLTALAIQRRTAEINAERNDEFEPIKMHVGVNSGIASVGVTKIEGLAGTRWTYTASGPTTNIAARLAALSEGGMVVISEETRQRLGGEFDLEDLGRQVLKNVAQPVRAYRLVPKVFEPAAGTIERRRYPRRQVTWPVRIWVGEETVVGHAVDASLYGICVATVPAALLRPGQSCHIELLPGTDQESACSAEVKYLADRGVGIETKQALPLEGRLT